MIEPNITELHREQNPFPSITDYLTDVKPFSIVTIAVGGLLFLIIKAIFLRTLYTILKTGRAAYRWRSLFLCAIYPVIALMALTTLVIPKAGLLCSSVMHIYFSINAYQYYLLLFKYVGNEKKYLSVADLEIFNMRTPPCCCCCFCCHPMAVTKGRVKLVRFMIFQLQFVQSGIMIALNVLYFKDFDTYKKINIYLIPLTVSSILTAIWGLNILVRFIRPHAPDHNILRKYFCVQLVVVFCKLKPALLDLLLGLINFPNFYPLTKSVYKQGIIQIVILCEMIFLSLLALKAYKLPKRV